MPKAERRRVVHKFMSLGVSSLMPPELFMACSAKWADEKSKRLPFNFSTEWEHVTCKRCLRAKEKNPT